MVFFWLELCPARIKVSESREKQARKRGPYGRKKIERDASIQISEKLFKGFEEEQLLGTGSTTENSMIDRTVIVDDEVSRQLHFFFIS